MKDLKKGFKIIAILIIGLVYTGCEEDDNVRPGVEAIFSHTINQKTGVVRFLNTSSNADKYNWDFGNNTTSTEVNPTRTFAPGTYTVTLFASNVAGASSTFEDSITIEDNGDSGGGGTCDAQTT